MSYVPYCVLRYPRTLVASALVEVLLRAGLRYQTFFCSTMHAIETEMVTKSARTEIVTLAFHAYSHTQHLTSEEHNQVCERLVQMYPVLKDITGNG